MRVTVTITNVYFGTPEDSAKVSYTVEGSGLIGTKWVERDEGIRLLDKINVPVSVEL